VVVDFKRLPHIAWCTNR